MAANSTTFKPGRKKTGGRKAGVQNKPTALETALSAAIEEIGSDGYGNGGAVGYMIRIASDYPEAFCKLLAHIIKMEMKAEMKKMPLAYYSDQELWNEMRRRNLLAENFSETHQWTLTLRFGC